MEIQKRRSFGSKETSKAFFSSVQTAEVRAASERLLHLQLPPMVALIISVYPASSKADATLS
jgi:hypothetical protein